MASPTRSLVRQLRLREGADLGGVRVDVGGLHGLLRGRLQSGDGARAGQEAVFHRGDRLVVVVDTLGKALAQVFDVTGDDSEAFVQVTAQRNDVVGLLVDGRTRPGAGARAGHR